MDNKMDIAFPKKNVQDIELSHSIEVDSFTGSTSIDVPLFFTKGRSGFTPDFSLHYSSSGKNSVFGKGWDLSGVSTISISTKHHFPRYDNTDEYVFNGNSDLVPVLENESGKQVRKIRENEDFLIEHYQLKLDNLYTRFEKWIEKSTMHTHWKVRETNGIVSVYGRNNTGVSRIFDQENPSKIFGWLLEAKYASDGNAILFEYKAEDYEQVERLSSNEIHRTMQKLNSAQRYLKRIYYGNPIPLRPDSELSAESEWFYQIIFDFGEHLLDPLSCYPESNAWNCRTDAFSSYYTGFEIRTYRLCRRILVFHNISSLREDSPQLIGCYELKYSEEPTGNQLNNILFTGFRYHSDLSELEQRSLPPLRFSYSQPELGDGFVNAVQDVFENFPGGFNEANSRWIDLYGDGVPGILTETDRAWYYKPNLGNGNFGKQHKVANKPSSSKGIYGISDFDGNGNQHLVVFEGRNAGYFEFNRDLDSWNEYKTFPVSPHIDHNKNVQFIDLSGNGSADIIVSKQDSFIYYPSKGKEGFGSPVEYAKPKSNGTSKVLMVGDKPANNHFLADMTGDGFLDQVFVSKGRIEYWPNMGNGVFGDGVLMENSPAFDFTYEFDMKRLRFADITGNGISDLIYIGRGKIFCWINFFGNKFLDPRIIDNIPYIDNISTVNILDFLGNGTPQLLWSSSLPGDMGNSIRYIQLMKGIKPNLLVSVDNSKGKKTYLKYTLSSKSYLDDKLKGRPWISRLPRHRIVVEKIEVHDLINQSRYVSSYKYHDGFFDSREKEFRGFGMVEQYDTESFESLDGIAVDEYSLPKCTRIWYHNGLPGWNEKRKKQYYNGDTYQPLLPECIIEDLSQLKGFEYEDAFLCLSGQKIREEVYTVGSDGNRFPHPIRVSQVNYGIRRIQPAINDVKARFDWYQQESLEINYEQAPFDPRINHQVNLNFDAYGNIQKVCTVGYPRRTAVSGRLLAQEKCHISSSLMSYINFNQENRYETGILYEHKTYEIGGLNPSENHIFSLTELRTEIESALLSPLDYNIPFDELADEAQAALRDWKRMFYWDTPSGSVLPLGSAGNVILVHHSEMACFTPAMIDELFAEKINSGILETRAHYNFHDGYWWKSEAVQHFLPAEAFYLVNYIENPDGGIVSFTYDEPYFMNIVRIQDSMGNRTSSEIDYHLNAPYRITDPNENITEVLYDPLGMILLSTSYGTILSDDGSSSAYGNRPLAAYIPVGDTDFNSILESPSAYLQHAGEYFYYDLESWERDEIPLRIIVLSREDYVDKGNGMLSENNRIQAAINYYDGFGREMQTKTRIEPGMVVRRDESGLVVIGPDDLPEEEFSEERWLVSGNKVYNNKQLLVKQYEPFFSGNPAFESDDELRMYGVSTHLFYDVEGRLLRQNMPNGSYAKTEISPWEVLAYDENDTIEDSIYRMKREALLNTHPEKMSLNRTLSHSNTPTISQIDPLGREIRTIQTAQVESENRITENYLDYYGNIVKIIDPRGLEAFVNVYDMTGQKLYEQSIDSGTRLIFPDGLNRPLFLWDGKGICTSYTFDLLGRPVSLTVEEPSGAVITTERYEYGESLSEPGPINARGNLVNYYDQAGIQTFKQYTPYRNPIEVNRQLTLDYKNIPDWTQVDLVEMDTEVYITQNVYDAFGRIIQQELPDNTTRNIEYLQSGPIRRILVSSSDGKVEKQEILYETGYNARGQNIYSRLGNGVEIQKEYQPDTFRLSRLLSTRPSTEIPDTSHNLQDITYTYDPIGNLIYYTDNEQMPGAGSHVLTGITVQPHSDFIYDTFYQLKEATGRVHEALGQFDYRRKADMPADVVNAMKGTRHLSLNNGAVVKRYRRTYDYDLSGNIIRIRHRGDTINWTNEKWISVLSNRSLPATDLNSLPLTDPELRFDENGNCLYMPHLRKIEWNYRNNISRVVFVDRSETGGQDNAEYYVYGGDGMRIRKVYENHDTESPRITEKIYLDGCEIKRIHHGSELILERYTSHIEDNTGRIAMIHRWNIDTRTLETDDISKPGFHYQLNNHQGSSSLEVDENCRIISYEEYFPFGRTAFIAGDIAEIDLKDYRYCGKEFDQTGFYYYGYRYYSCWLGNWLSPDPIGPEDALNLYLFVHNNPVNLHDNFGLSSRQGRREPVMPSPEGEQPQLNEPLVEVEVLIDSEQNGDEGNGICRDEGSCSGRTNFPGGGSGGRRRSVPNEQMPMDEEGNTQPPEIVVPSVDDGGGGIVDPQESESESGADSLESPEVYDPSQPPPNQPPDMVFILPLFEVPEESSENGAVIIPTIPECYFEGTCPNTSVDIFGNRERNNPTEENSPGTNNAENNNLPSPFTVDDESPHTTDNNPGNNARRSAPNEQHSVSEQEQHGRVTQTDPSVSTPNNTNEAIDVNQPPIIENSDSEHLGDNTNTEEPRGLATNIISEASDESALMQTASGLVNDAILASYDMHLGNLIQEEALNLHFSQFLNRNAIDAVIQTDIAMGVEGRTENLTSEMAARQATINQTNQDLMNNEARLERFRTQRENILTSGRARGLGAFAGSMAVVAGTATAVQNLIIEDSPTTPQLFEGYIAIPEAVGGLVLLGGSILSSATAISIGSIAVGLTSGTISAIHFGAKTYDAGREGNILDAVVYALFGVLGGIAAFIGAALSIAVMLGATISATAIATLLIIGGIAMLIAGLYEYFFGH